MDTRAGVLIPAHCQEDFQPVSPRDVVVRRDDEEALNKLARQTLKTPATKRGAGSRSL